MGGKFTNAISVPRKNSDALTSVHVPNANGVVLARSGNVAVWQQNDGEDTGCVTDECL